jgi:AraC-like DNA-binding protein
MPSQAQGPLVLAPTLEAFQRRPRGHYIVLRTSMHFIAAHGTLSGAVLWGEPTEADVQRMLRVTMAIATVPPPRVAIIDARSLGRVDPLSFRALVRYAIEYASGIALRVSSLAVVHAHDVAGAVAAGFFQVAPLPLPLKAFTQVQPALRWLGRGADAPLLAEVERLATRARALPPEIRDLASVLENEPRATLTRAALALAVSKRTLQRLLAEHGTSFRRELDAARVRLAQRLLLESTERISRVAMEIGCSSPQQLSGLFRRVLGESPSEWRSRTRTPPS